MCPHTENRARRSPGLGLCSGTFYNFHRGPGSARGPCTCAAGPAGRAGLSPPVGEGPGPGSASRRGRRAPREGVSCVGRGLRPHEPGRLAHCGELCVCVFAHVCDGVCVAVVCVCVSVTVVCVTGVCDRATACVRGVLRGRWWPGQGESQGCLTNICRHLLCARRCVWGWDE